MTRTKQANDREFLFDGRQGNLGKQMHQVGRPFYDTHCISALRDYIEMDIKQYGPMKITVKHSEEGSGVFARWLRECISNPDNGLPDSNRGGKRTQDRTENRIVVRLLGIHVSDPLRAKPYCRLYPSDFNTRF